jgi:hypothetical protein
MRAAIEQGPVFGSALFVSARRAAPARAPKRTALAAGSRPAARVQARRRIGMGERAIIVTNPAGRASMRAVQAKSARRTRASRTSLYASLAGALLFSAAAFGLSLAVDAPRTLMSRGDYASARQAIETDVRAAIGRCRTVDAMERDVCKAEARAQGRVQRADLDARYHGTVNAANDAQLARVKAQFEVARARCNAVAGGARAQCISAARADKARAYAQARPAAT